MLNRPTVHERLLWSKRLRVSTVPLGPTAAVARSLIPASAVSSLCATAAEGRWRRCERGFWQFRPGYPGPPASILWHPDRDDDGTTSFHYQRRECGTPQIPKPRDAQCLRCLYFQRILLSAKSIDGISWRWNRWKFFTVRDTVKKFRLGVGGQKYGIAPTLILQGLARAGDR